MDILECEQAINFYKEKIAAVKLLHDKLDVIKDIVSTMEVFLTITIEIQRPTVTLSDFFGFWLILELKINESKSEDHVTQMADYLHTAMERRKSKLLESEVMLAAIWLDPRYRHKILHDSNKVRKAKLTISNIWEKIKFNKNRQNRVLIPSVPVPVPAAKPKLTLQSLYSQLDDEFNADGVPSVETLMEPQMQSQPNYSKNKSEVLLDMDKFDPPRMKPSESVVEFWLKTKEGTNYFQELAVVAFVIMAICPSEVQTERDMSKLAFIFDEGRASLNEDLLEHIILIHLNKDLFYKVKEELIASVK